MFPVSERFHAAVQGSHRMVAKCEVMRGGEVLGEPLLMTGGNTISDRDATIRCAGNIEAVDEDGFIARELAAGQETVGILSPFTTELRVWRGVKFSDDTEELAPLGTFRIKKGTLSETDGTVTFKAETFDRTLRCQESMRQPLYITSGTKIEDAIPRLIQLRIPDVPFVLPVTGWTLPGLLLKEADQVWDMASKIAQSVGYEVFFDRLGQCVIAPIVSGRGAQRPLEFTEGANATFFDPSRSIDSDDIPNVVIVIGTNPAAKHIRAEVGDIDPNSPTYRFGPYGEKIVTITSEKIVTTDQAKTVAASILARKLGASEEFEFQAAPDSSIDTGDMITVTRERLGLDHRQMIIAKIDMPHTAEGAMRVTARRTVLNREDAILSGQLVG